MDREGWKRRAAAAGYVLGVLLVIGGAVTGEAALFLLGLVVLAVVLVAANG